MLIRSEHLRGIRDGTITSAFRRWRRPTVRAGGSLKTAIGVIAIDAVDKLAIRDLTLDAAREAGYPTLKELLDEVRSREGTLYRIRLRFAGNDSRIKLRRADKFSAREGERILELLRRLDSRCKRGPWTQEILVLICDHPEVRASELAAQLGRDTLAFKRDVRKLKELGLTESLKIGYRLSPRGERVLSILRQR